MREILKNTLLLLLGLLSFQYGHSQAKDSLKSNLHVKKIIIKDSLIIDSLSTDFNSFKIKGIPDSDYLFYPEKSLLVWKHLPRNTDSITITYRTLPLSFTKPVSHKSRKQVDTNIAFPFYSFSEKELTQPTNFVQFNSIDYSGTYGRSMTIGNGQDASLNSNFNMQLNGYILDSVRIEAALSDNNVPFQPDGNTQRLQEFDQVYITFEKGGHKLTAGDYDLKRPDSYFMNFDKRVQGLLYQGNFNKNKKIQNKVGISGSVAKGEFARNIFQGTEGNQGPYKLTGNNGEQFFIVIAGSERVYINGILLQRGQDKDYTIDYNTAEVTFMPTQMITKDSRIQVEFEYQNRTYLNTLLYAYDELNINNKWHFKLNAYSNQDSKNQSYTQDLDADERNFLRSIGDRISDAYYPSYQVDTFAENKILYRMMDTVVGGRLYDSVFIYSTSRDSVLYNLNFSFVGANKGNYILSGANTNGRSYRWVAPVNNVPQGDYTPMILLVTPKRQQMFTLSSDYQIDKNKSVGLEMAASNYAPNLFATENKNKHWGFAGKGYYKEKRDFGGKDSLKKANWSIENALTYEWTQSNFTAIAPFRNVEFDRDWNLFDSVTTTDAPSDNIADFQTKLTRRSWGDLAYQFSLYQKGDLYHAQRHIVTLNFHHGTVNGGAIYNFMESQQTGLKTQYLRPSAFIEKSFPKIKDIILGLQWQQEHNEIQNTDSNTLSASSYAHNTVGVYIKNDESKNINFKIGYTLRNDQQPNPDGFTHLSYAQDIEAGLNIKQWKNQTISLTGTFRKLSTMDSTLINSAQGGKNILGRLQYNGLIKKGFILPITLYEIGSGQQQKQEYTYVQVPAGQGNYMWIDYNGDGVQQANEFELAIYPDQKQYIRILTPTNEFEAVNYTRLTQSLTIRPELLWRIKDKKDWQKFISRFSNQLSYQVDNQSLAAGGLGGYDPFVNSVAEDDIISSSNILNNTFYFNQLSSIWGINYNYSNRSTKSLLTYGLEGDQVKQNNVETRVVFARKLTLKVTGTTGNRNHNSALDDDDQSYQIQQVSLNPEFSWISQNRIRLLLGFKQDRRNNAPEWGGEHAVIRSVNLGFRLNSPNTGNLNITGTYSGIKYDGEDNTPVSYVILDALKKGSNWLWHITWERNIGKGLQISLDYDGRKSVGTKIIHTGTMSIRALL